MTIDIEAIRKRAAAATLGPWVTEEDYYDGLRYSIEVAAPDPDEPGEQVIVARCKDKCGLHRKLFRREDADFIATARSDVPALCDEVELLREQLADALEEVRRLTPSPAAPHGYYLATIGSGGGVEGASEPAYTVFLSDRNIVLHGEEAQQFLEAQRASFPKPEPVEVLDAPKGDENGL